jgi:hypothetical protein
MYNQETAVRCLVSSGMKALKADEDLAEDNRSAMLSSKIGQRHALGRTAVKFNAPQ